MADMSGQVALVTGGTRGIGLAISETLVDRGVNVAAGYSRDAEAAKRLAEAHPDATITLHQGNIGSSEDCERVIDEVIEQHGRLDILVNNAGINIDKTVRKMTPDEWDQVVHVNLSGAFYLSRAVLNHMVERKYGRIINISSVIGQTGNVGQANYAAAKKGVTVNSVAPGFVRTEMVTAMPESALEKIVAQIPAGRLGEPEEVARVVAFLADPDSSYITGEVYGINGGLYM